MKIKKYLTNVWDAVCSAYDAADSLRYRQDLGWGKTVARDEDSVAGEKRLEDIRLKAIDLKRNNPVVSGVCQRLALFTVGASGIVPQCKTSDSGWNRAAEAWWQEYSQRCDSRKRQSLYEFQQMAVSLRPIMGGIYFQLVNDGTIRPIECERIRQPQDPTTAKQFRDGVKVNSITGEIETYCVHARADDGSFGQKHAEKMIPANEILRAITPPWRADQVREIPDLTPIIPALQDLHEMNLYTLNSAKWQSQILGFLKKKDGSGLASFERGSNTTTAQVRKTFKFDWGQILEGFPGDDLDMKASVVPNTTHIPYAKMQYGLCAAALNFPYEFLTLDLSGLDYSRQKGMLLLVNYACRPWKRWLTDSFLRPLWSWRIAKEMRPGGALAPAPTHEGISEWQKVEWQYPEEPWIDRQEAQQADVLEIQSGLSTLSEACKRRGKDFEDVLRQKAKDQKLIEDIAAESGVEEKDLVFMQIPGQTFEQETSGEKDDADSE